MSGLMPDASQAVGTKPNQIRGSCLCGAVKFVITSPVRGMGHCHCSLCRRQHGAAFSTYCEIDNAAFEIRSGGELLETYPSSETAERVFCRDCGSKLLFRLHAINDRVWIPAGVLDDDPGVMPGYHIFVASKAPWYEIEDDLPQYDDWPA